MGASPEWKVYDRQGEYRAACTHPSEAAAVVALLGEGATIRYQHRRIVWKEGSPSVYIPRQRRGDGYAAESYDEVAEKCFKRCQGRKGER